MSLLTTEPSIRQGHFGEPCMNEWDDFEILLCGVRRHLLVQQISTVTQQWLRDGQRSKHTIVLRLSNSPHLQRTSLSRFDFFKATVSTIRMKPGTSLKVVVVGASAVGKSSIVQRLVQGTFTEDGSTTCGADFYTYQCPVGDSSVKLQIWDTAGQERFRSISKSYFRNAVGAILVYDITSLSSFDELVDWLDDLQSLCLPNAYILIVGNKADLEKERQVGAQQVREFTERYKLESMETSALSGSNVKEAFTRLAMAVVSRVNNNEITPNSPTKQLPQLSQAEEAKEKKQCC